MVAIKDETLIEEKGETFVIHSNVSELFNAQQFLTIVESLRQKRTQLTGELKKANKLLEIYEPQVKNAQMIMMKEIDKAKENEKSVAK